MLILWLKMTPLYLCDEPFNNQNVVFLVFFLPLTHSLVLFSFSTLAIYCNINKNVAFRMEIHCENFRNRIPSNLIVCQDQCVSLVLLYPNTIARRKISSTLTSWKAYARNVNLFVHIHKGRYVLVYGIDVRRYVVVMNSLVCVKRRLLQRNNS